MAYVDLKKRMVQVKIVYYGPGRGGKTTNLEYIYRKLRDRIQTDMISIKTHGDRTLFFDYFPLDVGEIRGFETRIQLYTAPGQVKYNETKKLVLRGVDGIVFVADSMALRREKNIQSLKNLQENLATHEKSIFKIPLVMQYNKRDLVNKGIPLTPAETLEKTLNKQLKSPAFEASALRGSNVIKTLKKIISLTLESFENESGGGNGRGVPESKTGGAGCRGMHGKTHSCSERRQDNQTHERQCDR